MATAQSIVLRALRIIRVIDAHTAPEAADTVDAMETLNAMLAEWHVAGIGVPDYELASYTTELASDAADREAIAYQLAARIAPEYGKELSQTAAETANATMSRLRLRYFQPGTADLSEMPSTRCAYNIATDDFA